MESRGKKGKEQRKKRKSKVKKQSFIIVVFALLLFSAIAIRTISHKKDTSKEETTIQKKQSSHEETKKEATTKKDEDPSKKFLKTVNLSSTELQLVGPDNKIEKLINEETDLAPIGNFRVNKRIVTSYEGLSKAAQNAGFPLVIVSAYRSVPYQKQVLDQGIQQRMASGMNYDQALADAKNTMTVPGYSEHHTGLAMDVVDKNWANSFSPEILHENFGKTSGAKWLAENAAMYGFIIRYPEGKKTSTKIDYEPWHIRYVGKENAEYMYKNHLTLEEFRMKVKESKS